MLVKHPLCMRPLLANARMCLNIHMLSLMHTGARVCVRQCACVREPA